MACRANQKEWIADRRIDALGQQVPPGAVLDDGPQHAVELSGRLAGADHGDIGRLDNRGMALEQLGKALTGGDR